MSMCRMASQASSTREAPPGKQAPDRMPPTFVEVFVDQQDAALGREQTSIVDVRVGLEFRRRYGGRNVRQKSFMQRRCRARRRANNNTAGRMCDRNRPSDARDRRRTALRARNTCDGRHRISIASLTQYACGNFLESLAASAVGSTARRELVQSCAAEWHRPRGPVPCRASGGFSLALCRRDQMRIAPVPSSAGIKAALSGCESAGSSKLTDKNSRPASLVRFQAAPSSTAPGCPRRGRGSPDPCRFCLARAEATLLRCSVSVLISPM